jgi:hypothetical protein
MSNVTPIKKIMGAAARVGVPPELSEILQSINNYLARFVAYPSEHARAAHVLWIAHAHLMDHWDTTPRLAFMSVEKESGKTRALEVTALLVPDPILSISASPAVIVRLVSQGKPTILYDEIDGVFGNAKAQEANTDLRSILNGGYRRGAKVHRCVTHGKRIETEELDAFAPVALAGLRDLPDTLSSRSIFIRMKRRAPGELVESFRYKLHPKQAEPIKEAMADWAFHHGGSLTEPELPPGIEDRSADCWEPLLAIAEKAGDDWPNKAREAAVYLASRVKDEAQTWGVELLGHIREGFGAEDKLSTETLLHRLCSRDESPWNDLFGKPLNDRGLAKRLKPYGVKSRDVRLGDKAKKGYVAADFQDAWDRYLGPAPCKGDKRDSATSEQNQGDFVADVADVADGSNDVADVSRQMSRTIDSKNNDVADVADVAATGQSCPSCDGVGCPWCQPENHGIRPRAR